MAGLPGVGSIRRHKMNLDFLPYPPRGLKFLEEHRRSPIRLAVEKFVLSCQSLFAAPIYEFKGKADSEGA